MKHNFNAYTRSVFFVLLFFIGISYSYGNFDKSFECLKFTMADSVRNVGEAVLTDSIYWQHDSLIGDYLKYEYVEIKEFSKRNKLLRSEEHTSELQSPGHLVCRLLLEKKKRSCSESD